MPFEKLGEVLLSWGVGRLDVVHQDSEMLCGTLR